MRATTAEAKHREPLSLTRTTIPPTLEFRPHRLAHLTDVRSPSAAITLPIVILRDVVGEDAQRVANHHEDFCSLYVIRSGRGIHVIDGTDYAVARGDVYVMGPGMTHWFRDSEELTADTLHFSLGLFTPEERAVLNTLPGFHALFVGEAAKQPAVNRRWLHLTPVAYEVIIAEIAELRAEWRRGTPDGVLLVRALFLRLLTHLARGFETTESGTRGDRPADTREETVADALRFMETHFAGPLRIEQVAAAVCLSPDRFTEVFSRAMGRTPRNYLRHLRLERARMLLATTRIPVEEIARRSGFGNAAYLARVLKTASGLTPTAIRKRTER
ncbi:MAG: helix-turn-helix domain-containing protein [Capsulimonadales bacterium]|nr:helix-turn-helix domain-containing protein [Capsulimonadales bacterium]